MRNTFHSIRTFGFYLLPAALLTTASALLMALLHHSGTDCRVAPAVVVADHAKVDHADAMMAIALAEALRQLQVERGTSSLTLMRRDQGGGWSAEQPALFQSAPLRVEPGNPPQRPVLIRL